MMKGTVILDFSAGRVWKPGDEGYERELKKARARMKRQRMSATNAMPPPDWRTK